MSVACPLLRLIHLCRLTTNSRQGRSSRSRTLANVPALSNLKKWQQSSVLHESSQRVCIGDNCGSIMSRKCVSLCKGIRLRKPSNKSRCTMAINVLRLRTISMLSSRNTSPIVQPWSLRMLSEITLWSESVSRTMSSSLKAFIGASTMSCRHFGNPNVS